MIPKFKEEIALGDLIGTLNNCSNPIDSRRLISSESSLDELYTVYYQALDKNKDNK
jgi:hypothetical protein